MKLFYTLLFIFYCTITVAQDIAPLVSSRYGQGVPYNGLCPNGSAAGCGPVAIAQILNRYKTPLHGYGSISYTSNGNTINVDLENIVFDWDNILDEYKSYTAIQGKAVANLIYACGVAMQAQYGESTSIGNYARMLYGLQHHLHFSSNSRYLRRQFYSTAEWIEIMNKQLRDGLPIFYRGTWFFNDSRSDHMFVIDGFTDKGEYHVNFGHNGNGDKYTNINVINQSGTSAGGRGVCYNSSQAMVVNLFPTPDYEAYPKQSCISEEPIILNNDINTKQITANLGDVFTLSCRLRNCSAEKATINYGWALLKDGNLIDILGQRSYGLSAGNQFVEARHLNVSLPKKLEDGEYLLSLYSKSDIEPAWAKVWICAPTDVQVYVANGKATVTVPDNHKLYPNLYLDESINEVSNEFANIVPGRTFSLKINNPSVNNFENAIRLSIVADNTDYTYETILPVYSQTENVFCILVPQEKADLAGKNITSVTASYYYDIENRYIKLSTTIPSSIESDNIQNQASADICIYSIRGDLVKNIRAQEIGSLYKSILTVLPHGIYIIKEGNKTRKIVL